MPERPTALITGATSGIGAAAAVRLGERGWHVFVHGRDRERGERVVERIGGTDGDATFVRADFASRDAVSDLADEIHDRTDRLDALVHNAGLIGGECRLVWDGIEEMFAINHLAPYRLTHDLLDLLEASDPARIVFTSSTVHTRGNLAFDGPADLDCSQDLDAFTRYGRSKLASLTFAMELADRLRSRDIAVHAFHPGAVPGSRMYRNQHALLRAAMWLTQHLPLVGTSVTEAAESLVHLTTAEELQETTGIYFDGDERTDPDQRVHDPDHREDVWALSARLTDVDPEWP